MKAIIAILSIFCFFVISCQKSEAVVVNDTKKEIRSTVGDEPPLGHKMWSWAPSTQNCECFMYWYDPYQPGGKGYIIVNSNECAGIPNDCN